MNYNPYAAPQPAPQGGPQGQGFAQGQPQPWEIGEVLSKAWEIYKANWGVLTGAIAVFIFLAGVPGAGVNFGLAASGNGPGTGLYTGVSNGMMLLTQLVSAFLSVGLVRMCLTAARGGTPEFGMLFSAGPKFLPYFGLTLLILLSYAIGFVFFVIPAFILSSSLWLANFYLVDADLGVIDSLRAAWDTARGQRLNLFGFLFIGGLFVGAGVVACCVGVFATWPIFFIAQAIVFLRVSGRGAPALPAAGYGGPPPGYGGPPPAGGGYGGPPPGYGPPPGGYGGPPGGAPPGGGGYGGPPPGGYGPPGGGGYGPAGGGPAR